MRTKLVRVILFINILYFIFPADMAAQRRKDVKKPSKTIVVKNRKAHSQKNVVSLPAGHKTFAAGGISYYYHGGKFYRKNSTGFAVVTGPVGLRIKVLPAGHWTVYVGSVPFYYYYGTYYRFDPDTEEYIVVDAPEEEEDADVVRMTGGSKLVGRFLGGNEDTIEFNVEGKVYEIPINDVLSISFEQVNESQ